MSTIAKREFTEREKNAIELFKIIAIMSNNTVDMTTFDNLTMHSEQLHNKSIKSTIYNLHCDLERLKSLYPDWDK